MTTGNDSPGLNAFLLGARDTIPMIVGAMPFGLIYGTLAAQALPSFAHSQLMSATVFAGSAQFIALGLIAGHAGLVVIWLTTFVVNLRHMLYAATLLPSVAALPLRWRTVLGFLLTDETFAVMVARRQSVPDDPEIRWYFLGSGVALYVTWNMVTLLGLVFGSAFPQLQSLGLDYAIVATFVAIVVPQLGRMPHLAAAIAAGLLAYLWQDLPYKLGLLAATMAGVAVGLACARWRAHA